MKCVILTFHDVNNYGAVLQAYSLKCYLERMGHSVNFADAKPDIIKESYRINPFRRPFGIKIFARRMISYFFPQLRETISFKRFIKRNMGKTIRADMDSFRRIGTEAVINPSTGVVTLPAADTLVKLTATLTLNAATGNKIYNITVKAGGGAPTVLKTIDFGTTAKIGYA